MKLIKKHVLFIWLASLAGIAHAAESNWVRAGKTPDGARYLIDLDNVTLVGTSTWFWTKLADAPSKHYDLVVAKNYVDCAHRDKAFITSQTFYDKNGNDLGTTRKVRTIEVEDNSPMFSFVEGACSISEALKPTDNAASAPEFRRVDLPYGVSIDIPSHWTVLNQATRENIGAVGAAVMSNSGIADLDDHKERLRAVSASPEPVGAIIRVNVTSPADFSQADLAAASAADLKALEDESRKMYKQMESSGSPKIIEVQPVRVDTINGKLALAIPYIRAGLNGPSPWQVTQYKIPVGDRMIELTLSQRESDSFLWRPIQERVKRSLRF